jgi:hypothetical protein
MSWLDRHRPVAVISIVLFLSANQSISAQELGAVSDDQPHGVSSSTTLFVEPRPLAVIKPHKTRSATVQWRSLLGDSLRFWAVEHAFRCATEEGTREGFGNPFFKGYFRSVINLHGWADGDEFYVNYVGHPMQGAVASNIWANNDPAFHQVGFSSDSRYWKSKIRGLAFSFLQSAQFEMGPMSEASIGNIQSEYPQQGFVDFVMTPAGGLAWSLGEDVIDRYIIHYLETRTQNRWARLLARGGLNPARSMGNVMGGKLPWHRNNRPGVGKYDPAIASMLIKQPQPARIIAPPGVDKFDFTFRSVIRSYIGKNSPGMCVGGEGVGAFRVSTDWQALVTVGGCKTFGLPENVTGDSLDYMVGARWSQAASSNWIPRAQILVGGVKVTQERMFPETKNFLLKAAIEEGEPKPSHEQYTLSTDRNNFAIRAGLGLDVKLNRAIALQLAALDYSHAWGSQLGSTDYRNNVQFTAGMVLRMGTW